MQKHPDAIRWSARYTESADEWLQHSPSPLLLRFAASLPTKGLVLEAAAGVAHNSLFLA